MLLPLASARSLIYLEHGVLERLSLARQQSQGQGRHFLHRREGALLEKSGRRGQRKIGMSKQATPRDKCWTKGAIDIAATIANFMALADPLGGSHAHFCCSSSSEDFGCAKKTDRKSMRLWLIQVLIFWRTSFVSGLTLAASCLRRSNPARTSSAAVPQVCFSALFFLIRSVGMLRRACAGIQHLPHLPTSVSVEFQRYGASKLQLDL